MNNHPRSWAASLLGFALTVLAACWAINWAVRLLLAVWPVLVGLVVLVLGGSVAWRFYRAHDYW